MGTPITCLPLLKVVTCLVIGQFRPPGRCAVGLGEFDIAERRDRSPWVLGMVVQSASRGLGVGCLLLSRLEQYAAGQGYPRVWVATGDPAVGFYRRCGWEEVERLPPSWGNQLTILTRTL